MEWKKLGLLCIVSIAVLFFLAAAGIGWAGATVLSSDSKRIIIDEIEIDDENYEITEVLKAVDFREFKRIEILFNTSADISAITTKARITFQIAKEVFANREDIGLYYEGENETWKETPIKYIGETEEYEQYQGEVPIKKGGNLFLIEWCQATTEEIKVVNGTAIFDDISRMVPKIVFSEKTMTGTIGRINIHDNTEEFRMIKLKLKKTIESEATITFNIQKDWIKSRGKDKENVRLYQECEDGWKRLQTKHIKSFKEYEQYQAIATVANEREVFSISYRGDCSRNIMITIVAIWLVIIIAIILIIRNLRVK